MSKKLKNPEEWKNEIKHCRAEVRRVVKEYSEAQLNQRPKPGGWSALECVQHLNLTAELMAPVLEKAVESARKKGIEGTVPFYTGFIGAWFMRGSGPKGGKIPAPPQYRPKGGGKDMVSDLNAAETAKTFDELQQRWLDIIEKGEGLQLDSFRARSPVIPILRLNVATWLEAMPGHQLRHLEQMKRALGER